MTPANTVSRARPAFLRRSRDHDGDDQRHLDHRHGDGQDQRAERLAGAMCDHLGVVHGRENGGDETGPGDRGNKAADPDEEDASAG